MAFSSHISYIGDFILLQLGVATYLAEGASLLDSSIRVLRPEIFDPSGGTVWSADDMITYTEVTGDSLTGIPSTGNGAINVALNNYFNASPSIVHQAGEASLVEIENAIDSTKTWVDPVELDEDVDKKRYFTSVKWMDDNNTIRDDDDDSYSTLTPDVIDRRNGIYEFTVARTESRLYIAGYRYNPFYAIAEIYERFAADSRFMKFFQLGQASVSQMSPMEMARFWRAKGHPLSL